MNALRRFALWLVMDSPVPLGFLAPHVFAFGMGGMGQRYHKTKRENPNA